MSQQSLKIDDEGYLLQGQTRMGDPAFGRPILENLYTHNRVYYSKWQNTEIFIQAFDAPLVVQTVDLLGDQLKLNFPYGYSQVVDPQFIRVDEWDRFHFHEPGKIPAVFARKAQALLFGLTKEYDDDSITLGKSRIEVKPFLPDTKAASAENFWTQKYQEWADTEKAPGWDLNQPTPFLSHVLPQLKILRQRVAVLGCGAGHDAAYLASLGHIVTAFDISPEAIARAKAKYPESTNLKYVQMDLLNPEREFFGQFDLVFEHTFFCAINPADRPKAINTMNQLMSAEGHLLASFFMITPEGGPPFGATEWEMRKRLDGKFKALYWTRWNASPKDRAGWELIIYASKKNRF